MVLIDVNGNFDRLINRGRLDPTIGGRITISGCSKVVEFPLLQQSYLPRYLEQHQGTPVSEQRRCRNTEVACK